MVDEIFTGDLKWYKSTDDRYTLLRSKSNKNKSDIVEQKSDKQPDTTDMVGLEGKKSAALRRNQQGKGLKILTSNQMFSRFPISLAQLKAEINYDKLKNKIRQLLYPLYRSKKPTKQLYKSLIDII